MSAYDYSLKAIDGKPLPMKKFEGKPVLLVNVASYCGFTPQYSDLEKLHEDLCRPGARRAGRALQRLRRPGAGQRKRDRQILRDKFRRDLSAGIEGKGHRADAHPLYKWIGKELGEGALPKWNFHKYLIGKDGSIVGSWPSRVTPMSSEITQAVEAALA